MNLDKDKLEQTLNKMGFEYSYSNESGYLDETKAEMMFYADLFNPWFTTIHPLTDENGNIIEE